MDTHFDQGPRGSLPSSGAGSRLAWCLHPKWRLESDGVRGRALRYHRQLDWRDTDYGQTNEVWPEERNCLTGWPTNAWVHDSVAAGIFQ
jgi:hypothetical protein